MNQNRLTGLQGPVVDQRVVHGRKCDGERGGILEAHALRDVKQPAVIRQCKLRESCGAGAHHLVADLEVLGVGTQLGDLARPLHAQHCAGASRAAVNMPLGHAKVGTIEAAGVHANKHLFARGGWLGDIGDSSAVGAVDEGLHELSFQWLSMRSAYSAA